MCLSTGSNQLGVLSRLIVKEENARKKRDVAVFCLFVFFRAGVVLSFKDNSLHLRGKKSPPGVSSFQKRSQRLEKALVATVCDLGPVTQVPAIRVCGGGNDTPPLRRCLLL